MNAEYEKTIRDLTNKVSDVTSSYYKNNSFVSYKRPNLNYIWSFVALFVFYILLRPKIVTDEVHDTTERSLNFKKVILTTIVTWFILVSVYLLHGYKKNAYNK